MTRKTRPPRPTPDRITATAERCPAIYRDTMRPKLAAVETARMAGQPIPATDWRCIRTEHCDGTDPLTEHLATPLGVRGPSHRFSGDQVDPGPEPTPEPDPDPPTDNAHVLHLVDQLARRGAGVVRAADGDTLVLLVPDGDHLLEPDPDAPDEQPVDAATAIMTALAGALPGVAVLVLSGVTGAVVVPAPLLTRAGMDVSDAEAAELRTKFREQLSASTGTHTLRRD